MESPPIGTSPKLSAYLTRLYSKLDYIIANRDKPEKFTALPDKPIIGKIYYFSNTVLPTITQEGYWGYTSSGWVLLG